MKIAAIARGAEFRPKSTNELFPDPSCPICRESMAETATIIVQTKKDGRKLEIHAACLPESGNSIA